MSDTQDNTFTVDVHHMVPPDFKTTYATGALISAMPSGDLHLAFYIDRPPIADLVTFQVEQGQPMKEVNKSIRNGLTRDFQNAVVLDSRTASAFAEALQRVLSIIRQQQEAIIANQSQS